MQITTYYAIQNPRSGQVDADVQALLHFINDTSSGNGDNRSWNTMRARIDAELDRQTQERLGIGLEIQQDEADDD